MKKIIHKINKSRKKKKKIVQKIVRKKILRKPFKVKAKAKVKVKLKAKPQARVKAKEKAKPKAIVSRLKTHKLVHKTAPVRPGLIRSQVVFGPINVKPYKPGKNEEYMSKKQLEHFRAVLLQWKNQLMVEVDRTMHHMQNGVSNYPDPVDRASQEEEFNLELRARDRERKLLRKIEETLSRINDNDYGYCDDCGAEIGTRRLEARPTATQCIECKTIAEIREKQVGEGG